MADFETNYFASKQPFDYFYYNSATSLVRGRASGKEFQMTMAAEYVATFLAWTIENGLTSALVYHNSGEMYK